MAGYKVDYTDCKYVIAIWWRQLLDRDNKLHCVYMLNIDCLFLSFFLIYRACGEFDFIFIAVDYYYYFLKF